MARIGTLTKSQPFTTTKPNRLSSIPVATHRMTAAKTDLWALDFDGVACDSCGESSLSAWKVRCWLVTKSALLTCWLTKSSPLSVPPIQAATKLWPDVFTSEEALARKDQVIEDMRAVRPVVETG